MALSAFIFDLDGTLVDTTEQHARAWREAFDQFGYQVGADRIAQDIGMGGDKLVPDLLGQNAEDEHGDALRDTHADCYRQILERESVRLFPQIEALFEALHARDLRIAIATAATRENLDKTLEHVDLDLLELADVVVTDSDVSESKPHPAAVRPAADKLGVHPAQCAMVGDTIYDAQACRDAGFVALGVTTGPHTRAQLWQAGMRGIYDGIAELLDELDDVLDLASPGPHHLSAAVLDELMTTALQEAQTALEAGQVPIGSVLARSDGTVLARGHNETRHLETPVAHAEMQTFRAAASRVPNDARDLVLVTTLEPCTMCLGAALVQRVDTVAYALAAPPNGGRQRVAPHAPPTGYLPRFIGDVQAAESRRLLRLWLERHPEAGFVRDLLHEDA